MLEMEPDLAQHMPQLIAQRSLSPQWIALLDHWDRLCDCMDQEHPDWRTKPGSAPATKAMMDEVLASIEACPVSSTHQGGGLYTSRQGL